jgi:hypothetical protein
MKKILLVIVGVALAFTSLTAQDYTKQGTVYSQKKDETPKEEKTGFTYQDKNGNQFDIYISKSGSCYIYRVSKKTSNPYKYYLGEEISKDICKQLNREYKAKK